jgi:hypothetical protein
MPRRTTGRKELGVDGVIFEPRGFDGTGKGEDTFSIEAVVVGGTRGVPIFAVLDGVLGVLADECTGIGVLG